MKLSRLLTVIALAAMTCLGIISATLFLSANRRNKSLESELLASRVALTNAQADASVTRGLVSSFQSKLDEVSAAASNSTERLRAFEAAAAEHQRASESQRQAAEQPISAKPSIAAPAAKSGPDVQKVRIYKVLTDYSFLKCETSKGDLTIRGCPVGIVKYLNGIADLRIKVADMATKIEANESAARRANAVALTGAGGNAAYVDAAMAERARANLMMEDVRDQKVNFEKWKKNLAEWEANLEKRTTINAYDTGKSYGGAPLWICTGMSN